MVFDGSKIMFSKFSNSDGDVVIAHNVVGVHRTSATGMTTIICIGTTIKCNDPERSTFISVSKTIKNAFICAELTVDISHLIAAFMYKDPASKQSCIDFHICSHTNNIYTAKFESHDQAARAMRYLNKSHVV